MSFCPNCGKTVENSLHLVGTPCSCGVYLISDDDGKTFRVWEMKK